MALRAIKDFHDSGGLSMGTTTTHSLEQFRAVAAILMQTVGRVLSELILECQIRHGISDEFVMPLGVRVIVNAYTVAGYPDFGIDNPLKRHVVAAARAVTCLFDGIMAMADENIGFAEVPVNLTAHFLELMSAFAASYEAWTVYDTRRLVERIKRALEALYSAMMLVGDDEPVTIAQFDSHIVRLRAQMVQMDHTQRGFLAVVEMCRMQRVVRRMPSVAKVFVTVQNRIRLMWGLKENKVTRQKLAALRQILESKSICFDLFIMIAQRVLLTSIAGQ
jgi:hypothetical protein